MDLVSVLVCTRNRPESLLRTVQSILRDGAPDFELLVMDQSDGRESEQALAPFAEDDRFRYIRTRARGKGASLNEGLRLARGAVVACTDDDCVPPPDWPRAMATVMAAHPRAALVFCNVEPQPYDRASGYVPAYERTADRELRALADAKEGIGLGAGMALRRTVILELGGFDETFGPGARFRSGDDWDLAVRVLLHGWQVYDTAAVSVLHYGFRTLADGREHAMRDWVAIGALCAKPLRAGYTAILPVATALFVREALWPPLRDILRFERPRGLARILGFARGFLEGLQISVDRTTLLFESDRRDVQAK
jgi:glycosyltransferase involved in cell wall biosynthesis